jgi:hypothetical protein
MNKHRPFYIGLALIVFAGLALAAQNVNFSGKWVLDKSEPKFSPSSAARPGFGGGYPGGGGGYPGGGFPGGGFPGGRLGGGFPGGGGRYPGGGGGNPGSRTPSPEFGGGEEKDLTLNIDQTATELKISRQWTSNDKPQTLEQTFTLDGKEIENPAPTGGVIVTKSKWSKGTLVTEGTQQILMGEREVDLRIKEECSLSKDGKTLTIKTTRKSERGQMQVKQTFKRSNES